MTVLRTEAEEFVMHMPEKMTGFVYVTKEIKGYRRPGIQGLRWQEESIWYLWIQMTVCTGSW